MFKKEFRKMFDLNDVAKTNTIKKSILNSNV